MKKITLLSIFILNSAFGYCQFGSQISESVTSTRLESIREKTYVLISNRNYSNRREFIKEAFEKYWKVGSVEFIDDEFILKNVPNKHKINIFQKYKYTLRISSYGAVKNEVDVFGITYVYHTDNKYVDLGTMTQNLKNKVGPGIEEPGFSANSVNSAKNDRNDYKLYISHAVQTMNALYQNYESQQAEGEKKRTKRLACECKEKTILVNKDLFDKTFADLRDAYPYGIEIVDSERIEKAIYEQEDVLIAMFTNSYLNKWTTCLYSPLQGENFWTKPKEYGFMDITKETRDKNMLYSLSELSRVMKKCKP